MKSKLTNLSALAAIALAVLSSSVALAAPTKQWSHGNPTGEEQLALEVINRVRRGPVEAGDYFLAQTSRYPKLKAVVDGSWTRDSSANVIYGADAVRSIFAERMKWFDQPNDLYSKPPAPPLVLYPAFSSEAIEHFATIMSGPYPLSGIKDGVTSLGHEPVNSSPAVFSGPSATGGIATSHADGATPTGAFDWDYTAMAYNFAEGTTLREAIIGHYSPSFIWMFRTGHVVDRVGFGPNFTIKRGTTRMLGISSHPGVAGGARALSFYMTDNETLKTSDLPAGGDTIFVTGVIFRDTDKSGDYTPGEGVGGVKITPSSGDWYAITSDSGGYAFPVSKNAGAITIIASGNGVETSNVVTVGAESIKLDFVTAPTGERPAQVTVNGTDGTNQFVNLSTRGVAEPGERALFGGFVISGTGKKRVLIRGVAESLLGFGVRGVLRKPVLTLYDSANKPVKTVRTQEMYSWKWVDGVGSVAEVKPELATVFAQAGAFPLVVNKATGSSNGDFPAGDTAMVVELQPGSYTVSIAPDADTSVRIVQSGGTTGDVTESMYQENPGLYPGVNRDPDTWGNSGIVLLEVYDLNPNSGSRFSNLATRGKVELGARQMLVGFVVNGNGHRRLLVRGIGPALKNYGLTTALEDSAVELFNATGASVAKNDDWTQASWTDQQRGVATSVGAFALSESSKDGAILACVTPGLYSAAVSSLTGNPGVGLAEIYEAK